MPFHHPETRPLQESLLEQHYCGQYLQKPVRRRLIQVVVGLPIAEGQFGAGRERVRQVQEVPVRPQEFQGELQDNAAQVAEEGRRRRGS